MLVFFGPPVNVRARQAEELAELDAASTALERSGLEERATLLRATRRSESLKRIESYLEALGPFSAPLAEHETGEASCSAADCDRFSICYSRSPRSPSRSTLRIATTEDPTPTGKTAA